MSRTSGRPSRSTSSACPRSVALSATGDSAVGCAEMSRRAVASASTMVIPSAWNGRAETCLLTSSAAPCCAAESAMRSVASSSSSPQREGRSITVTPETSSTRVEACTPSVSTTMWGSSAVVAPRENRARSRIPAGSSSSRSLIRDPIMRAGPSASRPLRECVCGSHFAHSHCGRAD